MIRTGLAEMFPKSSEYLDIGPVIPGASFLEGTVSQQHIVILDVQVMSTDHLSILHTI